MPLYNPQPAGSTSASGDLELDGTAGDIQPVGTSAAAGSAGKAADAGHVHAQQASVVGGTLQLTGNNAIAGANAGLDAAFANVLRLYNNYASGSTQYVTPNGSSQFYAGGNNTFNVTSTGAALVPNVSTTAGGAQALAIGASAVLGVYFGSGAPTVSAPQGSLYLRTDGSGTGSRMYVNTNGSTTWTAVTTAG